MAVVTDPHLTHFLFQTRTKAKEKSFWQASVSHSMFIMIINLQVILSIDRFWAVCHPISYFKFVSPKCRIWSVVTNIAACVIFGFVCGLHVCVIEPSLNPLIENTFTNCSNYKRHKKLVKNFFAVYAMAGLTIVVGLSGFVIFTMTQRVSRNST